MDSILQRIFHVICYIDNILVSSTTVAEHDSNLEEVLKRLQEHGDCLKQEKCSFFKSSIVAANAYAYGIGAVIHHSFPDGSERPIYYASRSLSCPERNYSTHK